MTKLLVPLIAASALIACCRPASAETRVASPDGSIVVEFELSDTGEPSYKVTRRGEPLVAPSRMGFLLRGGVSLAEGFAIDHQGRKSVDTSWTQPWGECEAVHDRHNELRVGLAQPGGDRLRMSVVFRVFDDGVAFRYTLPEQENLTDVVVADELTEFALAGDWPAWWIPAFQDNRYEYIYSQTPASKTDAVHTPVTFRAGDRCYVSLHEAALVDFSSMALKRTEGTTLKAALYPWSDGVLVRAATPMESPWRTIQVADTPAGLYQSAMLLNLNEPSKLGDTSWIETGKYVGVWWEMHVGRSTWESGEKHGATTENTKRFIDFAARHGFKGVLVEGWNQGWDGDWIQNGKKFSFTEPYPDFDIEEVTRYANDRGVFLIGHHETAGAIPNYESQLDEALDLYQRLGVRAVKTGYVDFGPGIERIDERGNEVGEWHHGQYMVRHHQHVVEQAAKHKIMVVAHEAIKDTGLRRTWPNFLSRECARGQEYNAWSGEYRNPPDHVSVLAFTRMLSGPMDFTPGVFDLKLTTGDKPGNQIPSTLAKQLALYVVIYSPMQMACDFPEVYEKEPDALAWIVDVPTNWEQTRALSGGIGDHCVVARQERDGERWYLGAVGDDEARTLDTPLSFLDPDKTYTARIWRDADDAHWRDNPTAYAVEERGVTSDTVLTLKLAPGGGQAIRFTPN
ncbi:glycoside hydrolase family 97 protein [Botrimarina sp.]|uniref:glycoside hydrolase family 97 protein n=1 Tax=Botrimarina sp. TaxID=2795802 RepID=UPI0032ED6308